LKEEALAHNLWRNDFGRSFQPALRQTIWWWWWFI